LCSRFGKLFYIHFPLFFFFLLSFFFSPHFPFLISCSPFGFIRSPRSTTCLYSCSFLLLLRLHLPHASSCTAVWLPAPSARPTPGGHRATVSGTPPRAPPAASCSLLPPGRLPATSSPAFCSRPPHLGFPPPVSSSSEPRLRHSREQRWQARWRRRRRHAEVRFVAPPTKQAILGCPPVLRWSRREAPHLAGLRVELEPKPREAVFNYLLFLRMAHLRILFRACLQKRKKKNYKRKDAKEILLI
jgi:hypothetical protein